MSKSRSFVNFSNTSNKEDKLSLYKLHLDLIFDYGINFKERIIVLSSDIEEGLFEFVDASLTEMESQGRGKIIVKINSYGGDFYEALAIVGRIQKTKNKNIQVITEGYGKVMSASTLILASGTKRRISKYAFFMHHGSSYGVKGRHEDIKDYVNQAEKENKLWNKWIAELSKKSVKFWEDAARKKDAYFTAEELKKLGVVDEVF